MKVAVVTPTIGSEHLSQCIDSVQNQTYENLTHYIFLDGEEHYELYHQKKRFMDLISRLDRDGIYWEYVK